MEHDIFWQTFCHMVHRHQIHIALHSIHPLSSHHIRLHYTTHHIIQCHLILTSFDIMIHHNVFAKYADMPGPYWTASLVDTTWGGGLIAPSRDCSHLASMASQGARSNWCPSQQSTVLLPSDCSEHCIHTATVGLSQLLHLCFVPFPQHFLHFVCVIFS